MLSGPILIGSPFLLVAVDSAMAFGRGWRPGSAAQWLISGAGLAGCVLLIAALVVPGARRYFRARASELLLLGGVILAATAGVELVLRLIPPAPQAPFHHMPPNLSIIVTPPEVTPARKFSTNSEGIRGPEFSAASALRILCVGGSTTQCHFLDDSQVWTRLLMDKLDDRYGSGQAWVGGVGVPGFTSSKHLRYLETNPTIGRYTHVVFLMGINELLFWLGFRAITLDPPAGAEGPYWQKTATYDRVAGLFEPKADPVTNRTDPWRLSEAIAARSAATIVDDYPDPRRVLSGYRSRINALIDRCEDLGVKPVFVTQPVLWDRNLPEESLKRLWMGSMQQNNTYLSVSSLRELMDRFNGVLIETCRKRGVTTVDLSPMSGNPEYFADDCHFTAHGAEVVADRLAEIPWQ